MPKPDSVPLEISQWTRTETWRGKPSVFELIRRHYEFYRYDKFAQVIYGYVYSKETMANTIKELIPRKDYEFLLARLDPSYEFIGWIGLSFCTEGKDNENRDKYEARLEWTEMCSHILKGWKIDMAGKKSNVWDEIKRASSDLQAKHLPRNYCIINTLVLYPVYQKVGIQKRLLEHAIDFWRKKVMVGTEWAMWVQAPPFARSMYKKYGFQEVGEYEVELGDYGFPPKEDRKISGKYTWKFMVLRGASGAATKVTDERRIYEIGKDEEQELEDVEEIVLAPKVDKGKGKEQQLGDLQIDEATRSASVGLADDDAERIQAWKEAEKRLEEIRTRQGMPPLPGEVACLTRIQRKTEEQGPDTTGLSKGKGVKGIFEGVGPAPSREPLARSVQDNAGVTGRPKDNFTLTKSEENFVETMRNDGVAEEEIELMMALKFSMSDEARGR